MTFIIESEDRYFHSMENEITDPEVFDPKSEKSIQITDRIFSLVSNRNAILYELGLVDPEGKLTQYDPKKREYRMLDGEFTYIIPRSVVTGQTNIITRKKYEAADTFEKAFIILPTKLANNISDFFSNLKKTPRFDWKNSNTVELDYETLKDIWED